MTVAQYKIRKYIKDNKITIANLSLKLGYDQKAIYRIYDGRFPAIRYIKDYEGLFNIKSDLGNDEKKSFLLDKYGSYKGMRDWYKMQTGFSIHAETISGWLKGIRLPRPDRMRLFCTLFNIKNEWIEESKIDIPIRVHEKRVLRVPDTTAQIKIRSVLGYDSIREGCLSIGITDDYRNVLKILSGYKPTRAIQRRLNHFFGINNDLINGAAKKAIGNISQGYRDYINIYNSDIEFESFRRVILGQSLQNKDVCDICKYFNLQNDYFI